ncbi:thioredoxin [Saccharothrix violaceirubra]|uniref:Thioredoxin n=1 Tax=Saccharothrix violaceirubra TaxID=413306 RepID=A0A7W7WT86_9PSEU|nr:thioredoxin domain-containing protein [Saccharothrix violaceirubra]MBB4962945.1 thioredoxin 1 [Saccharothrix violaceirubra]
MRTLNDETFRETVGGGAVLVEFSATWCPPCRMVEPVLDEIDRELAGLDVYKIDTDESPVTARDQKVMSAPTMQLWRDGELVAQIVGARPKSQLLAWLEPHLG